MPYLISATKVIEIYYCGKGYGFISNVLGHFQCGPGDIEKTSNNSESSKKFLPIRIIPRIHYNAGSHKEF